MSVNLQRPSIDSEPGLEADRRPIGATNPADWLPPVADHVLLGIMRREALKHGLPAPMRIYRRSGWMVQNSAASAELLECVLASGASWWVLWKREPSPAPDGDGCPTGVAYETRVYEHILAPGGHGPPRFLGGSHNAATGEDWLFVEFLQGAVRLPGFPIDVAGSAASWLGPLPSLVRTVADHAGILVRPPIRRGLVPRSSGPGAGLGRCRRSRVARRRRDRRLVATRPCRAP